MAYTPAEIRKFRGLFLQANSFDVPEGALEVAENVILKSDHIISKTPGFYTYWEASDGPLQFLVGLSYYNDTLIAFTQEGVGYFTDVAIASPQPEQAGAMAANGGIEPVFAMNSVRTSEQNLNIYFCGIDTSGFFGREPSSTYKLEDYNEPVRLAGISPGESLMAYLQPEATGPLPANSQSGYRYLYGRKDTNENLNLSAPSDIETVGVGPGEEGVAYISGGGGPYLVTVDTTEAHLMREGDEVIISNGSDSDVDGTQTLAAVGDNFFQFFVANDPGASGTLNFTATRSVILEIEIAALGVASDNYFIQIFRTSPSAGISVSPDPSTFGLIAEIPLTASDISNGVMFFHDEIDEILKGELLYTNPNSREGPLAANYRPPLAFDIALYKDFAFYANVRIDGFLSLDLIADSSILTSGDYIIISSPILVSVTFLAVGGTVPVGNRLVTATAVSGTTTITVTYNGHGFTSGDTLFIHVTAGSGTDAERVITVLNANQFTFVDTGATPTALQFEGVKNVFDEFFWYVGTATASIGFNIAQTAKYLVKAINRNGVYRGNYLSAFDDIAQGVIGITAPGANFDVVSNRGGIFIQPTDALSGYASDTINFPERLYFSKLGEPEAVPILNFFPVGSRNKPILRIWAMRDALIILKTDGIYKLVGNSPENFTVTEIDLTIFGIDDSAFPSNHGYKINNKVIALTNQGVVEIDENSAVIISRQIDDVMQDIVSGTISSVSFFGYETQRLVYMSIAYETGTGDETFSTFIYNVVNGEWTNSTEFFQVAALGPDDIMYIVPNDPENPSDEVNILRGRKEGTLLDYANEFMVGTLTPSADRLSGRIVFSGGSLISPPLDNSVLFYSERVTRIIGVTTIDAITYDLVFDRRTNAPASTPVTAYVYQPIRSLIKFAPFHAGSTGLSKHFAQFQIHLRQEQISELLLSFAGAYYNASENTDWDRLNLNFLSAGWGLEPWGLFPWGNPRSIRLIAGTRAANIIRTLVPRFAARNSFIQPILSHSVAAEALMIQALSWSLRTYGERVSR